MKEIKKKNIVFLGLIKNSENTLKYFLNFYLKIKKKYNNCYLIIGENDSKDNTKEILNNFKKKNKNFFLVDTSFSSRYNFRLEKMSYLRDSLVRKTLDLNKKIDFICWFDLDDVIKESLSINKFCNSNLKLINDKNLFGISANSKPFYYDILSYRKKNFFTKNIYPISLEKNIFKGYKLRKQFIYDVQKKITDTKDHYTMSSFNGMCIYYYKYFKLGSYIDKKKIMRSQVEHVTLNMKIHKKTKKFIYIDKDFTLNLPGEHRPYFNILYFCLSKIFYYFKKLV